MEFLITVYLNRIIHEYILLKKSEDQEICKCRKVIFENNSELYCKNFTCFECFKKDPGQDTGIYL